MAMVSCGSSRTWTPCLGSRGGDEDGSSGCALTLYIPWLRCSSKALQPFLGIVFGWVVGAKSWQLHGSSQRVDGAADERAGAQHPRTPRAGGLLAIVFPVVDMRHDGLRDASGELLAYVPYRGGHLR